MRKTTPNLPSRIDATGITQFNALRHGVLSRYTVLPWEDAAEYGALVDALSAEHGPRGPTEVHLVEELGGILWRKRRLRMAEAAAHRRGLDDALEPRRKTAKVALTHRDTSEEPEDVADVVRTTSADTEEDIREIKEAEEVTRAALDLLGSGRTDAYEAALAALLEGTREWWAETLARQPDELDEDEQPATANSDGLRGFIEHEVLPWLETRRQHVDDRPAICGQAYGESLDPDRLERLGRYEVHLDRKLERTLSMLLKLKDLRQGRAAN